jgi:hypothetical protein
MNSTELLHQELRRPYATPSADRDARNRADALALRRQARRHRLAVKVRSVADRLEA